MSLSSPKDDVHEPEGEVKTDLPAPIRLESFPKEAPVAEGEADKKPKNPLTEAEIHGVATALVYFVSGIHTRLAILTGFEGWRLDQETRDAYEVLGREIAKALNLKYLGLVFAGLTVATSEVMTFMAYQDWKKHQTVPTSTSPKTNPVDGPREG